MNTARTRRENEVWQACDDLWALNANHDALKGDEIRTQLIKLGYKKGSPNEIYKYRQTWKESRGISEMAVVEAGQQSDPISRAVSLVYEQIQLEAAQKITAIQTDSESQVQILKEQNQELILACETTLQKHEALSEDHEGLNIAHETLREALAKEQSEHKETRIKLEGSEFLLSEIKAVYVGQVAKLEQSSKQQAVFLSDEISALKLELRLERDLRMKLEADKIRLERTVHLHQERSDKAALKTKLQEAALLKKEFQKIGSLIKAAVKTASRVKKSKKLAKKPIEVASL